MMAIISFKLLEKAKCTIGHCRKETRMEIGKNMIDRLQVASAYPGERVDHALL